MGPLPKKQCHGRDRFFLASHIFLPHNFFVDAATHLYLNDVCVRGSVVRSARLSRLFRERPPGAAVASSFGYPMLLDANLHFYMRDCPCLVYVRYAISQTPMLAGPFFCLSFFSLVPVFLLHRVFSHFSSSFTLLSSQTSVAFYKRKIIILNYYICGIKRTIKI